MATKYARMNRMKNLTLAVALSLAATSASAAEWNEVRLASEGAYPPFSETTAKGSLIGLDIDIGNAVCAQMKLKCTWVKQDWDGLIPGLIARKYDAVVASMSITEERKQKVDFSNKYYASPLVLIGKAGVALRPDVAALAGRKVAVQRGAIADHYATRFWARQGVTVVRLARQDEAYAELRAGRVDAALADYWEAKGGLLDTPGGADFAVLGERIYGRTSDERAIIGDGIGIAVRKQDRDLREIFNKGIAAIRANGTYVEITERYFSEDIYGN